MQVSIANKGTFATRKPIVATHARIRPVAPVKALPEDTGKEMAMDRRALITGLASVAAMTMLPGEAMALLDKKGLKFYDIVEGAGGEAVTGARVAIHYDVKFRNVTCTTGMRIGGLRRCIVPPELGYGKFGSGEIPPNSTLQIDVELLSIKQKTVLRPRPAAE
eukprot:gene22850-30024_t